MNLAGIDTNLVVALHALLGEKNVTRAAKRLGLGQSATSHALARLRRHFDDALLVRLGRGLALTERAKSLVEPCATAVAELERLFAAPLAFDPRTSNRVFRIAATITSSCMCCRGLPPSWPRRRRASRCAFST